MIRPYQLSDWKSVWQMIEPIFRAGETYAYSPDISESEAHDVWINKPLAVFVAEEKGAILGTYFLTQNQPGLGSHICNCGYIVSGEARGRGIASQMCSHSQSEAVSRGFRGMQFNLVVSRNEAAIRLWKKHGFAIVGTIPSAFRHAKFGYVDAYIMYKSLEAGSMPQR